jgi:hypothetical protein
MKFDTHTPLRHSYGGKDRFERNKSGFTVVNEAGYFRVPQPNYNDSSPKTSKFVKNFA